MNRNLNMAWLILRVAVGLAFGVVGRARAQTFTVLHTFREDSVDGANPRASLVLSADSLYGTTYLNGLDPNSGTVFVLSTNGTASDGIGFAAFSFGYCNCFEGAYPLGGLVLSGRTLYGTMSDHSDYSPGGTLFKVNADGTGFAVLHDFGWGLSAGEGKPIGAVLSGSTLYGAAAVGGAGSGGVIYKVSINGSGYSILHSFTQIYQNSAGQYTNSDGAAPSAALVLSGTTLYGTTSSGGTSGNGTIFRINVNGTGFSNLYNFSGFSGYLSNALGVFGTNNNGANPQAALLLSASTLYGTASAGGASGNGTVFALTTNGTGFTLLHTFTPTPSPRWTNIDGARPLAGLILAGNTLYGTANRGGDSSNGTVFALDIDGTGFRALYNFSALGYVSNFWFQGYTNHDGANPEAGLLLSGNTLYGTAANGGAWSAGTAFGFALLTQPRLTITPYGSNVVLQWPTNAPGFNLQSTSNLGPMAVWDPFFPEPLVIGGQNVVISSASSAAQFFRLAQ